MNLKEKKLYLQVLFATLIWGSAYPFTKYLMTEVSPLFLITIRAFIGFLFLFFFTKFKFEKHYINKDFLIKIFIMSIIGVSLQQYTQAYALKYTLATNAGWLIALTPILVILLEFIYGEKISFLKIIGFIFGFLGTLFIIASKNNLFQFSFISTKGDLIFLSSCFAWAFYVFLTKKWFFKYKQSKITTLTMFIALISILPFFFYQNSYKEFYNLSYKGFISLSYLAILSSGVSYLFWNDSVEGLGPTKTSYFIYDEPFATIFTAYFFLNEIISIYVLIGGFLILLGVYFVNTKREYIFLKNKELKI